MIPGASSMASSSTMASSSSSSSSSSTASLNYSNKTGGNPLNSQQSSSISKQNSTYQSVLNSIFNVSSINQIK